VRLAAAVLVSETVDEADKLGHVILVRLSRFGAHMCNC
jgi:hypothetical protein